MMRVAVRVPGTRGAGAPRRAATRRSGGSIPTSLAAEPDAREGGAEQEEQGGHREEHPPGMRHHRGGDAHPDPRARSARPGAAQRQTPGVHARAQHGEESGQEGQGVDDGEGHDDGAAEADGAEVAETAASTRPSSPMATVRPEKRMASPAVAIVRPSASSGAPGEISSR